MGWVLLPRALRKEREAAKSLKKLLILLTAALFSTELPVVTHWVLL